MAYKVISNLDLRGNQLLNAANVATKKQVGILAFIVALLTLGLVYVSIRHRS